jgi:hypothetical protein
MRLKAKSFFSFSDYLSLELENKLGRINAKGLYIGKTNQINAGAFWLI